MRGVAHAAPKGLGRGVPAVLHERNFSLLLTGQAISIIGDAISMIALPFAILAMGGSVGQVGLVLAARIGAVAVPIFSGFAAHAIATRFEDCGVRAVITADTTLRRGRPVPVRATVEEALALAPVEHVIVVGGAGHDHHDYAALLAAASGIHR